MAASSVSDMRRQALEAYEREPVPTWRRSGFWTTICAACGSTSSRCGITTLIRLPMSCRRS